MTVWKVDWRLCEPQSGFIGVGATFRASTHFELFQTKEGAEKKVASLQLASKEFGEPGMLSVQMAMVKVNP